MRCKSVRLILHQCPEDPSETVLFRISAGDVRNCVVQTVLRIVERYAVEPEKDVAAGGTGVDDGELGTGDGAGVSVVSGVGAAVAMAFSTVAGAVDATVDKTALAVATSLGDGSGEGSVRSQAANISATAMANNQWSLTPTYPISNSLDTGHTRSSTRAIAVSYGNAINHPVNASRHRELAFAKQRMWTADGEWLFRV